MLISFFDFTLYQFLSILYLRIFDSLNFLLIILGFFVLELFFILCMFIY
jgi:hypothetical protein